MTTTHRDGSERLPVYILAGGRSRRFGRDKARAMVNGQPLIVEVAERLRPVAETITVVARRPGQYADLGLATIEDVVSDKGPIGGLLTALEHREPHGWLFLTACDWVGTCIDWYRCLAAKRREHAGAVVFCSQRAEPLYGFYHTSIRGIVAAQINRDVLAMHALLDAIDTTVVTAPKDWSKATNLNTPGPLEADN